GADEPARGELSTEVARGQGRLHALLDDAHEPVDDRPEPRRGPGVELPLSARAALDDALDHGEGLELLRGDGRRASARLADPEPQRRLDRARPEVAIAQGGLQEEVVRAGGEARVGRG